MNLNKKLIALALTSAVSASTFAATATYQASVVALLEPTIAPTTALDFGKIAQITGSSCTMGMGAIKTGDCDLANNGTVGEVTLGGLTADTNLTINVTGTSAGALEYLPSWDINGAGTGDADGIGDGVATIVAVNGTSTDITLDVYGDINVLTDLTGGDTYTADYVVDVSFQ